MKSFQLWLPVKVVTRLRQSIGAFGQPSDSAIGRGIAMTTGDRAMLGCRVGNIEYASGRACATRIQVEESGAHTSGRGPSRLGSQVGLSVPATSPDLVEATETAAQEPPISGFFWVHCWASDDRILAWSGSATTLNVVGAPLQPCWASHAYPAVTPDSKRTATAEMTIHGAMANR